MRRFLLPCVCRSAASVSPIQAASAAWAGCAGGVHHTPFYLQVRLEEFATGAPWTSPGWPPYGTSRPGGRLDPSALATTEALVKHTPRAECPTLPPSPRRGTRHRAGSAVRVTSPALFIGRWDDEVELPEALWIHEGIDLRDLSVSDGERHHGEHSSGGRHHNSRGAVDEH